MKRVDLKDYARIPEHVSRAYMRAAYSLEEEPMIKRKIPAALVFALVLMLVTMTALAAALLGGKDFVQEVMRPMVQESEAQRLTEEEVAEILRIAAENGLHLSEAQQAWLLERGGYDKEELMRLFVKLDLGADPSTWSIEDQAWYGQLLVESGLYEETYYALPEEGEATEDEVLDRVQAYVHRQYDAEAPLADEAVYQRHTTYLWTQVNPETEAHEKQWTVRYEPLDVAHARYGFVLDTAANILSEWMEPGLADGAEPLTPLALRIRFEQVYGNFYGWEMETWVRFRQMLRKAEAAHGFGNEEALALLSLSDFALPMEAARPKDAAMDAAMEAIMAHESVQASDLRRDRAYAVCLQDGEAQVWKVTIPAVQEGDYIAEVEALTGEASNIYFVPYGSGSIARHFMLESVYQAHANAQPQTDAGTLRFDGRRYEAVEPLPDGGFLLAGSAWVSSVTTQAWAARVSPDGQTLWEVENDVGRKFTQAVALSDGGFLLAMEPKKGETFSLMLVTLDEAGRMRSEPVLLKDQGWASKGKDCLLIEKHYGSGTQPETIIAVNANGDVLWEHTYDALKGAGYHLYPAASGYILAGMAQDYPYNQQSGYGMMARLDDNGALLWRSLMKESPNTGISAYLEADDGGMFGAGMNYRRFEDDAKAEQQSDFVVRFDADGTIRWCHSYTQLAPPNTLSFRRLLPAPNDGVLVVGWELENETLRFIHLDKDGNVSGELTPQLPAILDYTGEGAFTAGEQRYFIYNSRPEYQAQGETSPSNVFIMPVNWPEG